MKKVLLILLLSSPGWATYSGFTYQRVLTINHSKVPNTDQNNFPVLIQSNDVTLSTGTGGHLANSNGYDIIFSTMIDCSFDLKWDTETINNTGSAYLNVWVAVPKVTTASDTTLYMCYGNSGITTYQGSSAATWDSNFAAVYHLSNGTTLSGKDSTSNGITAANAGASATTGQIDGGASFNGTSSYLYTGAAIDNYTPVTYSVWIKRASLSHPSVFWAIAGASNSGQYFAVDYLGDNHYYFGKAGVSGIAGNTAIADTNWHQIVAAYNGSTVYFYLDGAPDGSPGYSASFGSTGFQIGNVNGWYWNGNLDELRLSTSIRSADWIKTEYNNQSSPSTFLTIGAETTSGGAAASNAFFFGEF